MFCLINFFKKYLHTKYMIHNVSFQVIEEGSNEYYYSAEVTLKLSVIKELMEAKQVPNEIDYTDISDIQF
ncbi:MAG TPA: hypothetical protein GX497_05005 [Bacillus bacterium]|nr:hypothetical protein [Bacillus sp. (in: firmicutes)]